MSEINEMEQQRESGVVRQFLTFELNEEMYGLGVPGIREILEYQEVTRVPLTPDFIRGVINLRGNVVPIVDLHVRFGGRRKPATQRSCFIVVEIAHEGALLEMGMLVDSVYEVIDISETNIEPPPKFGAAIRTDFISGMGALEERFIVLLNHERVLDLEELSMVEAMVSERELGQEPGEGGR